MGFLSAVARFIAMERLQSLGQDVLAQGRRRFAEEMARGRSKEEAARTAASYMLKLAGAKGLGAAKNAGRVAGRTASAAARAARGRFRR